MKTVKNLIFNLIIIVLALTISGCSLNKTINSSNEKNKNSEIKDFKSSGGSSGMEQIGDNSYLAVYDIKNFKPGYRMGLIKVNEKSLEVKPIDITSWDVEGISSDLESICSFPGKHDEYLIAESGNWQGKLGRMFHIKVDTLLMKAKVLGRGRIPLLNRNDKGLVGDQYEAIICIPFEPNRYLVILGERGGSKKNPNGIIRWGMLDISNYKFYMSSPGKKGIEINAPGNWTNDKKNRDVTDFHVDKSGIIWASASEDQGDSGPFYSVVYKLGKINKADKNRPVIVEKKFDVYKEINGFKIEALSGPSKGINSTLTFGTEDEMYGGVWRPLNMDLD